MNYEAMKQDLLFGTGYGRPPKQSQFKKGQSGNPKGRPRSMASELPFTDQQTLRTVLEVAEREVSVRENGEVRQMSMREAAINALYAKAVKGDPRALVTLLTLTQKAEIVHAQDIAIRNELWQSYKARESANIAAAKARGGPVPSPLPHPDDIEIDHEKGPRFLGPVTEEERANSDHTCRLRDLLILQDELDHRSTTRLDGEPLTEPGGAALLARFLDDRLPPRLRLPDERWIWSMSKAQSVPKRILLKRLYEGWRELGHPQPRGFVFPNASSMQQAIRMSISIYRDVRRLPEPGKMGNSAWERAAADIILKHAGRDS